MTASKKDDDRARRNLLVLTGVGSVLMGVSALVEGLDTPYAIVSLLVGGFCASLMLVLLLEDR
ncbi:hypothetical protein [Rathayibacter sp. VKM Ac-2760]|uniref:hypothetical protein n=1 Tax=Rathayibacter sp. VKM Ac-2760 TaxID=2609253 RepID=UPI001318C39C|nr:hypothetical protein [Rathayibacter sp. VKM Ac-2760]QHC59527.1 hypothetical protein GSU72_13910 [Rathayibacter sp. VKM Ac-2760]